MSNKIFYSADYNNENFTGLFDRIINIKFIRKSGESFTLRSDYEPVWEGGTVYFKTCQPKPAIRVQYVQYQSTAIQVDIFVTNLNIIEYQGNKTKAAFDMKGPISAGAQAGNKTNQQSDILTVGGDPVVKAEIEMGYRGQFHRWDKERPTVLMTAERLYKSFLNLETPNLTLDWKQLIPAQKILKAQRRCTIDITWAVHTNNPPDRITQFHGYVGTTEAGFQPSANLTLDSSLFGQTGQILKKDLLNSLDDPYDPIETTSIKTPRTEKKKVYDKKKKKNVFKDVIVNDTTTAYRNLFNGGAPFTLLEAYCFHSVTRRFVRSDIDAKRNTQLENAAFEYSMASIYPSSKQNLKDIREEVAQRVYAKESKYSPENFVGMEGALSYSSIADSAYKATIEKGINKKMIDLYVGAKYTVKNLSEQRKLYKNIRKVLKTAYAEQRSLMWWDAAEQTGNFADEKIKVLDTSVKIEKTAESVRQFVLDTESGKYRGKDCYFEGNDWILPMQNSNTDAILKDVKQKDIIFYPPTKVSADGYATADKSVTRKVRCFSGLFEVRDAYMFGVPVLCTEKASKIFEEQQAGKAIIDFVFLADIEAQIEWICKTWNLSFIKIHDGGFCLRHLSEDERELASQDFVTSQSSAPFKIPAVYDVTLSPVRKIRMPFIAFLNPMQMVEWNSTSAIGEMVSFYYQPTKGRNFFMSYKSEIDFATVDDFNTMELSLTDAQYKDPTEIPAAVLKQEETVTYVKVLIIPDEQLDSWQEIYESPAGAVPIGLFPLWKGIGELTDEGRIPGLQFFTLMKTWNPDLFAMSTEKDTGWDWVDSFRRVDKTANKLYGADRPEADKKINFPAINYCLKKTEDAKKKRILLRFPLLPDVASYSKTGVKQYDENYILVYDKGVWEMQLTETVKSKWQIEEA